MKKWRQVSDFLYFAMRFGDIFIHPTILILLATLPEAGDSAVGQISVSALA